MPTITQAPRLALMAGACAAALLVQPAAQASSHREAPFITTQPKVDGTDLYMFRSYENGRSNYVTLIANYIPLQDPYGGPNYFAMDPNALYEIHVDNNGDAVEDISFQFRFKNNLADIALPIGGKSISIPLIQAGGISASSNAALNLKETFTLDVVRGDRRGGARTAVTNATGGGREFTKPVDFIGTKTFGSIAGYEAYAAQYIYTVNIPGCNGSGPGLRRPAQGSVRRQPWPHVRPDQPESARLQWRHRRPGRQERHHACAGSPRVLPDRRQ